jgi:hypothetical protein
MTGRMAGSCDNSNPGEKFSVAVVLHKANIGVFDSRTHRIAALPSRLDLGLLHVYRNASEFTNTADVVNMKMTEDDGHDQIAVEPMFA